MAALEVASPVPLNSKPLKTKPTIEAKGEISLFSTRRDKSLSIHVTVALFVIYNNYVCEHVILIPPCVKLSGI